MLPSFLWTENLKICLKKSKRHLLQQNFAYLSFYCATWKRFNVNVSEKQEAFFKMILDNWFFLCFAKAFCLTELQRIEINGSTSKPKLSVVQNCSFPCESLRLIRIILWVVDWSKSREKLKRWHTELYLAEVGGHLCRRNTVISCRKDQAYYYWRGKKKFPKSRRECFSFSSNKKATHVH